jgi:FkbM family methyltransferase
MIENYSIWDRLKENNRPIFMYGTGNGADKIIDALNKYGIKLDGIFASDGYVRDRYFRDMKVRSYSDVIAEYGDKITVLLAFGTTLDSVCEFIYELDRRHELIIPDVPLYGGELFDMNYYLAHKDKLDEAREIFDDQMSKNIFDDAINFRLTGKIEYLSRVGKHTDSLRELFGMQEMGLLVDAGAFKGDSTRDFAEALNVKKIIAVEADPKTYLKLKNYADEEMRSEILAINAAVWNENGTIEYVSSASRGSGEAGKNRRAKITEVNTRTLDTIIGGEAVDFIKLDIEGAEASALDGAEKALRLHEPNMEVSLYHRTDDLFAIPLRLKSTLPNHKFYLRRVPCIPMWDLNLYAVK